MDHSSVTVAHPLPKKPQSLYHVLWILIGVLDAVQGIRGQDTLKRIIRCEELVLVLVLLDHYFLDCFMHARRYWTSKYRTESPFAARLCLTDCHRPQIDVV